MVKSAPRYQTALTWRTVLAFSLRRNLVAATTWALISFLLVSATASLYMRLYPDQLGRQRLAVSLGANTAMTALLGTPRRLDTVGGFVAWRSSLGIAIVLCIWGLFAATKTLRGDEESGRWDLLVAQPITPRQVTMVSIAGLWIASLPIFLGLFLGIAASIPRSEYRLEDSVAFAASHTLVALVFVGVGSLASQLFVARRSANIASGTLLVAALITRSIASGTSTLDFLLWATPAGWLDQVSPFAGVRAEPIVLLVVAAVGIAATAVLFVGRRDIGAGLFRRAEVGSEKGMLLGFLPADAFRFTLTSFAGWLAATVASSATFGAMAPGLVNAVLESDLVARYQPLISFELATVKGFLGMSLQLFIGVVVCLLAAGHAAAIRNEEESGRLDVTLAAPVGRRAWLGSRATAGLVQATIVALAGGIAAWMGQALLGGDLSLGAVSRASLGFVPLAILYGGLGILAVGAVPRHASAIAWSVVPVTFFVYWIGSLLQAPRWILAMSPFYHLAPAPLRPVNLVSSVVMSVTGIALGISGIEVFARRDTVSE